LEWRLYVFARRQRQDGWDKFYSEVCPSQISVCEYENSRNEMEVFSKTAQTIVIEFQYFMETNIPK
jgi:hypothetical protein